MHLGRWFGLTMLAALWASPAVAFDRAAWLADFEQLKTAITDQSPNFDWAVERGMDLATIEARARTRLANAGDDFAARAAFDRFVGAFGDGHMELRWPVPSAASMPPAETMTCAALGYRDEPDRGAIASALPGYQPLSPDHGPVAAGIVTIAEHRIGVLRIAQFSPMAGHCRSALAKLGKRPTEACDSSCSDVVSRDADNLFLAEVATRLRTLGQLHPDVLLIDVAGNGGGNDSAVAIARMLASNELPSPRLAFIKSAARARDLDDTAVQLRAALAQATAAEADLLRPVLASIDQARAEVSLACDRSPAWHGQKVACTQVVTGRFFAGGLVDAALPAAFAERPWADLVSATSRFRTRSAMWRGPLLVLVDGNSASSTELFAAMLQDGGRATVVGSPSFGAGCGWTLGEHEIVLTNSGGRLSIPDCARFRRNGSNEIDGIQPEVLVGFREHDSTAQRAVRLAERLPMAVRVALGGPPD